jgi:hypothetical protein
MKKNVVKLGSVYACKVSGSVVPVRLDRESPHGGWVGVNVKTGKEVRIKSSQRLRGLWPKKTMPIATEKTDDKGVAETVAAVEKGNLAEGVTVPESNRGGGDNQTASERAVATSAPKAKKGRRAAKGTTGQAGCGTDEPGATGAKPERHSLLNLAAKALAEAGTPLNCKAMVERVLATGLWQSEGKTPAQTLASAILREMKTKGDQARFRKVGPGKFVAATK